MRKRQLLTQPKEPLLQPNVVKGEDPKDEEVHHANPIDVVEDAKRKGQPVRAKHKVKPKKSKRKCWHCGNPHHYKAHCPKIRCYYCHRLGHIVANCREKRMDKILKYMGEVMKVKQRKKEKKKKKDRIRNDLIDIYRKRLQQVEFQITKKGYELLWEKEPIGIYEAIGIPPSIEHIKHNDFKWKHVDVVVRYHTPLRNLSLLEDFLNNCGCGEYNLPKGNFKLHVNEKHKGIAQPSSRINCPPWIDGIIYYDSDIELLYSRSHEGLSSTRDK